ncbi:MAG: TIM-barrel domain-containing protein [Acidobacteriota bacterium]
MPPPISRRRVLQQIGVAGAGALLAPTALFGQRGDIIINGTPMRVAISEVRPWGLRITMVPALLPITDVPNDGALVSPFETHPMASPEWRSTTTRDGFTVTLTMDPPTIHVSKAGTTIQTLTFDPRDKAMRFALPRGPLLGFGEGGPQFDRKGQTYTNRSGQGGYRLQTHGGRVPIQWLVSATDGWGLFLHQPLGAFDLTGTDGVFTPAGNLIAPLDIFIVASKNPAELMKAFATITGFPEMPPLWSFGYQQSHRTLAGPDEVMGVAKTFREKKLPCDALIYLGTDFCPSGWNTHNGEFTWKADVFPDPKKMIDDLHAEHFKVVLHIVIEGKTLAGKVSDPCTAPPLPTGRIPESIKGSAGDWPPDRQVSCYWPAHKPLFDLGIDGWWPDQGDGLDAPSRLARNVMYYDGSLMYRPNERPYALHRNGYVGMARRAAFLWSGDVYSLWETLKTHVPNAVNTSLSGIPYWGTDIGGFVPTADFTGELFVRWFQFGAFNPLFRSHGRTWHLRLPWGWNTGELGFSEVSGYTNGAQDPPVSELHNPAVEPICKKFLELRYRLMPYLYTAVRECHDTGMPIIRAMWLHYPDDATAAARGDQYMWGRDMLVAPVVEKGATSRSLYLPKGTWIDFWTEQPVAGGREISRPVDLATMPLYVRAGAVLPVGPVKQYTAEPSTDPITLVVFPGANGASSLYEDDGATLNYRKNLGTSRCAFKWDHATRRLTITGGTTAAPRTFAVRLAGTDVVKSVKVSGRPVIVKL